MKKIAIIVLLALTLASCTDTDNKKVSTNNKTETKKQEQKTIVEKGDTIQVSYTGSTKDWVVFDSSTKHPGNPLIFVAGAGQMIPGFDQWVIWMKLGEEKTLNIKAKDAYGESDVVELKDADFKAIETQGWLKKSEIKVWDNKIPKTWGILKIVKIENWKYYAKNPNPLAGKDLIFQVKIEKIFPNPSIQKNTSVETKNTEKKEINNNKK